MSSVNKVILVGRLGRAPEIKKFDNGGILANLALATSQKWRDRQSGEMQEKTEWHRLVMRERLAEIAQQYLQKGSLIYVEGQLQTRKWQAKDGSDRYSTEIAVWQMQMLSTKAESQIGSGGGSSSGSSDSAENAYLAAKEGRAAPPAKAAPPAGSGFDDMEDDIPF